MRTGAAGVRSVRIGSSGGEGGEAGAGAGEVGGGDEVEVEAIGGAEVVRAVMMRWVECCVLGMRRKARDSARFWVVCPRELSPSHAAPLVGSDWFRSLSDKPRRASLHSAKR